MDHYFWCTEGDACRCDPDVTEEEAARSPHVCTEICGVHLHRCETCGYEGALSSLAPQCAGCAYLAEQRCPARQKRRGMMR